jgi:RNA recognition motif-containing protein
MEKAMKRSRRIFWDCDWLSQLFRKIFCGGISYDTSNDDLMAHFGQFGPVKEAVVKFDRMVCVYREIFKMANY